MLPPRKSSFSAALTALNAYNETLKQWPQWLGRSLNPGNADKFLLYETLQILEAQGMQEDEWANSRYQTFKGVMKAARDRIDKKVGKAVTALVKELDKQEFINEFRDYPIEKQLEQAHQFITALAASEPGQVYLRKCVAVAPTDTNLPLLHPQRFINSTQGDFDISFLKEDSEQQQCSDAQHTAMRAAELLSNVYFGLLPAMLDQLGDAEAQNQGAEAPKIPMETFHQYLEDFIDLCLPNTVDAFAQMDIDVQKGRAIVEKVQTDYKFKRGLFSQAGQSSVASFMLVLESLKLYYTYLEYKQYPSAMNLGDMATDTAGVMNSVAQLFALVVKKQNWKIAATRFTLYSSVFAFWDSAMRFIDAINALQDGYYIPAAGYGMGSTGIAIMTIANIALIGSVTAGTAIPIILPIAVALGFALTFIGCVLVEYFRPTEQLLWARHCYFGNQWADVTPGLDPQQDFFGFKRAYLTDGNPPVRYELPDIPGQVSRIYYKNNPFLARLTKLGTVESKLRIEPKSDGPKIPFEAEIVVKRIRLRQHDAGDYYEFLPVYHMPLATENMSKQPHGTPVDNPDFLLQWEHIFSSFRLRGDEDTTSFNPKGTLYEIDILPYGMIRSSFPSDMKVEDARRRATEITNRLPYLFRTIIEFNSTPEE
ncbi:MAG: hypothetical protein DIZ78_17180 [endosymbiont of Escarpia spicata]|uniref:Uncharacterized protein n=1 Tax=endosymbiont of Escarpia spicata TaxID=2200908 RepID=A0A370DB78_9GAMM|nr:MAG: hypothetical protein DIZ78_17180 [endosymbiont of Escarpia spicata]